MKREEQIKRMENLVRLMVDWARWVDAGRINLSAAQNSGSIFGSGSTAWDDFAEGLDKHDFEAVDAAVDSLPPAQGAAVQKRYGLCAVWRFPRDNYEQLLLQAHEALLVSLPRRNVVI